MFFYIENCWKRLYNQNKVKNILGKRVVFMYFIKRLCKTFVSFVKFSFRLELLKILVSVLIALNFIFIMKNDVFSSITSVLLIYAGNEFLNLCAKFKKMCKEEKVKLNQDYQSIIDKYRDDTSQMLVYTNNYKNKYSSKVISKTKCKEVISNNKRITNTYRFPIIYDKDQVLSTFTFEYSKGDYDLPSDIKERKSEVLRAHHASHAYNRTTQRIKSINKEGDSYNVSLEKTSYYNMLVSNRAIDYHLEGYGTIRDRYEEGPKISSLEDSVLANHFGYAIIVETSDNKFVFSQRKEHVSVGKNTLGTGVSSVLKVNLDKENYNNEELKEIFNKSINNEIQNEIGISNDGVKYNFDFDKNNIVVYRDLTEGGKPQFVFHLKLNINSTDFLNESKEYFLAKKILNCGDKKTKEDKHYDVDFALYTEQEFKEAYITSDYISIGNDLHRIIPLFSAAMVLYLNNIDKINRNN